MPPAADFLLAGRLVTVSGRRHLTLEVSAPAEEKKPTSIEEQERLKPFAEKFILALREIGGGTGRILSLLELRRYFLKLASEPRLAALARMIRPAILCSWRSNPGVGVRNSGKVRSLKSEMQGKNGSQKIKSHVAYRLPIAIQASGSDEKCIYLEK